MEIDLWESVDDSRQRVIWLAPMQRVPGLARLRYADQRPLYDIFNTFVT